MRASISMCINLAYIVLYTINKKSLGNLTLNHSGTWDRKYLNFKHSPKKERRKRKRKTNCLFVFLFASQEANTCQVSNEKLRQTLSSSPAYKSLLVFVTVPPCCCRILNATQLLRWLYRLVCSFTWVKCVWNHNVPRLLKQVILLNIVK